MVVEGQSQRFHCNLGNIDNDGASLSVPGLMGIPDSFNLFVEPDSVRHSCKVLERRGSFVRVSFTETEQNARYRAARV